MDKVAEAAADGGMRGSWDRCNWLGTPNSRRWAGERAAVPGLTMAGRVGPEEWRWLPSRDRTSTHTTATTAIAPDTAAIAMPARIMASGHCPQLVRLVDNDACRVISNQLPG